MDVRDIAGASALHKASDWQNLQIVQLLLERGASVNARYNRGSTPLHEALNRRDVAIVQALLEGGADVNAGDN